MRLECPREGCTPTGNETIKLMSSHITRSSVEMLYAKLAMMSALTMVIVACLTAQVAVSSDSNCLESCSQPSSCSKSQCSSAGQCGVTETTIVLGNNYPFCRCDADCAFYGDCCESTSSCTDLDGASGLSWECISTTGREEPGSSIENTDSGVPHVLMVGTCSSEWMATTSEAVAQQGLQDCEQSREEHSAPVTSNSTGVTYSSQQCAFCNGELQKDLVFWLQQYSCPELEPPFNQTVSELLKICKFCRYRHPELETKHCLARPCIPNTISTCPTGYPDSSVVSKCLSYSNPVAYGGKIYKNTDCALCNDVETQVPLATCAKEKIPGFTHTEEELKNALMHFQGNFYYQQCNYDQLLLQSSDDITVTPETSSTSLPNCNDTISLCLLVCPKSTTPPGLPEPDYYYYYHYFIEYTIVATPEPYLPPTYNLFLDVQNSGYELDTPFTQIEGTTQELCEEGMVYLPDASGGNGECRDIACLPGEVKVGSECIPVPSDSPAAILACMEVQEDFSINGTLVSDLIESAANEGNAEGLIVVTSEGALYMIGNVTLLCSAEFNSTDSTCVQLYGNDTQLATIEAHYGAVEDLEDGLIGNLTGGEAYKFNDTVFFCSNLTQEFNKTTLIEVPATFQTNLALEILTYTGTSLSILGCLVLLVTYSLFKQLRTLPGKSIMNLAVAILISDALFLGLVTANSYVNSEVFCTVDAVLLHYTFLSRFSWMSIIALHLVLVFASPFSHNYNTEKLKQHVERKTFLVYFILGWTLPLLVVGICIALDFSPLQLVGYGKDAKCWITERNALIGAFIVPVFISVIFNAVCFVLAVIFICRATTASKGKRESRWKTSRIRVYIALASIMGLTWIFGFVALAIDSLIPWYIFTVLNSTQGLFICVMFVFTKKIMQQCQSKIMRRKRRLTLRRPARKPAVSLPSGDKKLESTSVSGGVTAETFEESGYDDVYIPHYMNVRTHGVDLEMGTVTKEDENGYINVRRYVSNEAEAAYENVRRGGGQDEKQPMYVNTRHEAEAAYEDMGRRVGQDEKQPMYVNARHEAEAAYEDMGRRVGQDEKQPMYINARKGHVIPATDLQHRDKNCNVYCNCGGQTSKEQGESKMYVNVPTHSR